MEGFARSGLIALIAAVATSTPLTGTFSLLGGTPKIVAQMTVQQSANGMDSFDIVETQSQSTKPILKYDEDMTQLMHFVIISDDFTQFFHVHPALNPKTGHFTIDVALDPSRQYIAYADTEPAALGHQVFRFLVQPQQGAKPAPSSSDSFIPGVASAPSAGAGPYTVTLGSTTIDANAATAIPVTIKRDGTLATDLQPYLGAAAHAVFIDTATLAYIHVHPQGKSAASESMPGMDMPMGNVPSAAKAGPEMTLHVPALPAGTYKLWLEFRGQTTRHTAAFTIVAR